MITELENQTLPLTSKIEQYARLNAVSPNSPLTTFARIRMEGEAEHLTRKQKHAEKKAPSLGHTELSDKVRDQAGVNEQSPEHYSPEQDLTAIHEFETILDLAVDPEVAAHQLFYIVYLIKELQLHFPLLSNFAMITGGKFLEQQGYRTGATLDRLFAGQLAAQEKKAHFELAKNEQDEKMMSEAEREKQGFIQKCSKLEAILERFFSTHK